MDRQNDIQIAGRIDRVIWIYGWTDRLTDGWMDRQNKICINGWMDRWTDGLTDRWTDRITDGQIDNDIRTDGWTDRLTRWVGRWTDWYMDRWTDRLFVCHSVYPSRQMDRKADKQKNGQIDRMYFSIFNKLNLFNVKCTKHYASWFTF